MTVIKPGKLNAGSVAYYEQDVERSPVEVGTDMTDYYSEHGDRQPEVWAAGRSGEHVAEALERLGLQLGEDPGRAPIERWFNEGVAPTGEQLGQPYREGRQKRVKLKDESGKVVLDDEGKPLTRVETDGGTVRGWDLMTAAPKSVSVAWALADDETRATIEQIHREASEASLSYLAQHAAYTRKRVPGHDQAVVIESGAFTGVRYQHRTSRAVDPHLHDHVLVHGKVLDPSTGQWLSIDGTSFMHETKAAGTIYQAHLRAAVVEKLGWEFGDVDRDGLADIVGFDRDTIEAWSTRSSEIATWLEEKGLSSVSSAAEGQKATREAKDLSYTDEQLRTMWHDRARAEGLDVAGLTRPRRGSLGWLRRPTPPSPEDVLAAASRRRSTFTRSQVVQVAAALIPPRLVPPEQVVATAEDLADQALALAVRLEGAAAQGDTVTPRLADGRLYGTREGAVRFATRETIEMEATTTERAGARVPGLATDPTRVRPTRQLTATSGLSLDQLAAVRSLVGSDRRVSCLVAPAGAGKTRSLNVARLMWEHHGRTVRGLAPTGAAAGELVDAGAASSYETIATVLGKVRRGAGTGWRDGDVVLVDEAGMVGSYTIATLVDLAEQSGAKLVLIGDPEQMQPVEEAAGLFELLADDLPNTARLSEVWRQEDPEECAATLGLRGDATEADAVASTRWYADHGRVFAGDTATMREDTFADWAQAADEGLDAMMITNRWEEADALAAAAQDHERKAGRVDASRTVTIGDLDDAGRQKGGQVRDAGVGDLIQTRQNDYTLRTSTGASVRNGHTWRIAAIDGEGEHARIVLKRSGVETGESVMVPADYLAQHARLGYATSINGAQGATVDAGLALLDGNVTDQNALYTAATRGAKYNRIRIMAAVTGGHPDDHGHVPERFRAEPDEAGDLLLDLTSRARRDRSAHQVIREAHQSAHQKVTEQYGPEEASAALQRGALTDAAQAERDRLKRSQRLSGPGMPGQGSPGQRPGLGR